MIEENHCSFFYNIYDHHSVSISHASADMKEIFFICMKNFENDDLNF
jgi:hypothetical protein